MEIYGGKFGEFLCGYWRLRVKGVSGKKICQRPCPEILDHGQGAAVSLAHKEIKSGDVRSFYFWLQDYVNDLWICTHIQSSSSSLSFRVGPLRTLTRNYFFSRSSPGQYPHTNYLCLDLKN